MCDDITCDDLHLASVAGIDYIMSYDITCDDLHLASVAGMDDITCDNLIHDDLNPERVIMGLGLMIYCVMI